MNDYMRQEMLYELLNEVNKELDYYLLNKMDIFKVNQLLTMKTYITSKLIGVREKINQYEDWLYIDEDDWGF